MKRNRLIAFALSVSLLLGASACGKPAKTVSELIAEENAILDQHQELWTTALNSLDKDKLSQSTQSTNYADVLDLAINNVKDQLSDEDYKTLTDDAAKVRKLEDQLQELPPEEGTTTSASGSAPSSTPCGHRYLQKNGSPMPSSFVTSTGSSTTMISSTAYFT